MYPHCFYINSVSFPLLEPLILFFVKFLESRRAVDYLENSADMIIEARKKESKGNATVSSNMPKEHTSHYYTI